MPKITELCLHLLKLYRKKPWPRFSGHGVEAKVVMIVFLQIRANN